MVEFNSQDKSRKEAEHHYRQYAQKEVLANFNKLSMADRKKILKRFEVYLDKAARGMYVDVYRRNGLDNPLVQDQLYDYFKKSENELSETVASYDEWVGQLAKNDESSCVANRQKRRKDKVIKVSKVTVQN